MSAKRRKIRKFFMKCWTTVQKQQNFPINRNSMRRDRSVNSSGSGGFIWSRSVWDYRYLDAILQFIQYKCWCSGCRSMYVRLSARNLMDIERYKRYGFYVIAQEEQTTVQGEVSCAYVLKYPLPREWEEMMNKKERAFYYEGKR